MNRTLGFILLFLVSLSIKAQDYSNLQVSLLTVNPRPNYVHTIFGHTALRLYDPTTKTDVVFNWGAFNFNKPNFFWLFIKGETDYRLNTVPYSVFYMESTMGNATVTEQILEIPEDRKVQLIALLQKNLLPENLEYRYNFIFDNCTSRVRDIIEKCCGGELNYPKQKEETTFRKLIHECTQSYPWLEMGIDCMIGAGADSLITKRNELWLPVKLKDTLNESYIVQEDGSKQAIVRSSDIILLSEDSNKLSKSTWSQPLIVGFLLFILLSGILFVAYRKKRKYRFVPAVLFFTAGIGGCIVAITCFISIHPCTWPNWNILWLHPFHFIGFAGFFFTQMNVWITWYHRLNFVILALFLLGWCFIPQYLNPAFIPYILCLMLISGFQFSALKKREYE